MARVEFNQLKFYDKYVTRTRRCLPDKFVELCHLHLSLLLDLNGDKLELLLSGHEQHKKKKKKPALSFVGMFKKKDKQKGLFGLPLTDEGVCLMMPLIEFLKMENNVSEEGLFRKPGNMRRMTTLKQLLTVHGPTVSIDPQVFSAHDVACVLKEFIRELPEPLLTERHLEAHRLISALGQQAKTPEEIDGVSSRKLSSLQLLMLLMPSPTQKLTMHLVQLLQKVAGCPESKMTSATLGTIFAPIFFIERKVQPTDLHNQITTTAPAVSFMIDKAYELFQPPKQLVMDLAKFWKSMPQSFLHSENREYGQMQKSPNGQTNVCYTDSVLSKCDDSTSNTLAEVTQLEDVHTHSAMSKSWFDAHDFCTSLRRHSRSIGSSVRKRLTSLRRLRKREKDILTTTASSSLSSSDCKTDEADKTATSSRNRPFEWCSQTSEARNSLRLPKPGHKCCYTSENCPTAVFSSSSNIPVNKTCQETATCSVTLTVYGNQKHSNEAGCEALLTPSSHPTNVVSDFVENRHPKDLTSGLEDTSTCDIENKDNIGSAACNIENKDSTHHTSHFNGKADPVNTCMVQLQIGHPHTGLSLSVTKCKVSGRHLDRPVCFQSETSNDCLLHVTTKKITMEVTAGRHSNPVANTCQQPSRKAQTRAMAHVITRLNQDCILETAL